MIPVAIAMPLYNEAANISRTLVELDAALCEDGYEALFLVQNDASTDDSVDVIRANPLYEQGRIQLATNDVNVGHGPSVMRAYFRAVASNRELIAHIDSDGEVDARSIVKCLNRMSRNHVDAVIGLRKGRVGPFYRRTVTLLLRLGILMAFGVVSPDVNSPIRVYRRNRLIELLASCPGEPVTPHVLLTILTHKSGNEFIYQSVSMVDPLESPIGSTWKASKRVLGVPTRFIRLVAKALRELVVFRFRTTRS